MTYYQLFKLADFLSTNQAITTFIELEEATSFQEAFGELVISGVSLEGLMTKGLYIVVFPESEIDRNYLYEGIIKYCKDIEFNCTMISGVDRDGIYKLIIGVDETK